MLRIIQEMVSTYFWYEDKHNLNKNKEKRIYQMNRPTYGP